MVARAKWRGHPMHYDEQQSCWLYTGDGLPISQDPSRPCGECGLGITPEGHDGCLGTLPGVLNACCGHGDESDAYIQYSDKTCSSGQDALNELGALIEVNTFQGRSNRG